MSGKDAKRLVLIGIALLAISVLLYFALDLTSSWEQSKTPGEKNFGVAALFILFIGPIVLSGVGGLAALAWACLGYSFRIRGN